MTKYIIYPILLCFFIIGIFFVIPEVFAEDYEPLVNDGLIDPTRGKVEADRGGPSDNLGGAAYNAGFYDTSEYMYGSVSVTVILPESNGAVDPNLYNWSSTQENNVLSEVQTGMNWWANNEPRANLSFEYEIISGRTDSRAQTSYEPILRPSGATDGGANGEALWVDEIMGKLGYSSSDHLTNSRGFLNEQIAKKDTDWGVLVFVANTGSTPATSRFSDGMFAYSYYGGPFMVMTYNNYNYGIGNMDAVTAHELGHSFYALDQYFSAGQDCAASAGYLNVQNQNSQYSQGGGSCDLNVSSIMRGGVTPYTNNEIDRYAEGQMGLWDSNGDGFNNVVDTNPKVTVTSRSGSLNITIRGTAEVQPLTNENEYFSTLHYGQARRNISVNTISKVQYRIDGGDWQEASATDGSFNEGAESFNFATGTLTEGEHNIEVKTQNSVGNWSAITPADVQAFQAQFVAGAGDTGGPQARFFDSGGSLSSAGFFAFPSYWRTGLRVATGDVNADGKDDVITAPGPGGVPQVKVYNNDGTLRTSFYAYPEQFTGGVYVAAGDVDNDGTKEIITGTGNGGGPQVRVFDINGNPKFTPGFFAYGKTFRGGVYVGSGDINGDGKEEILTGAGSGGGPQVMAYTRYGVRILNYFAYADHIRTGVQVAAGDV
ncbi:VCBS repeat-containing protein, partial [Patescibacteria group bacterium]|nr:VCBS repeat-containing protein [Patescibacteria group bacterium]